MCAKSSYGITITDAQISYPTEEKWGDFANVEKMKDHITKAELDLEFIEKDEPVDFSDDVDGRMFTLVFKKVKAPKRKSLEWLIQKADDFKQAGNSGLFGELGPGLKGENRRRWEARMARIGEVWWGMGIHEPGYSRSFGELSLMVAVAVMPSMQDARSDNSRL